MPNQSVCVVRVTVVTPPSAVPVNRTTAETGGSASADTTLAFAATTDLKTGDNVIVVVEQNSGGSLTFKGNESRFTVELLN